MQAATSAMQFRDGTHREASPPSRARTRKDRQLPVREPEAPADPSRAGSNDGVPNFGSCVETRGAVRLRDADDRLRWGPRADRATPLLRAIEKSPTIACSTS